jgi:hypothetical protein
VGGYAVGFHSRPKFTQDLDFWIENSVENAERVKTVLNDFGFSGMDVSLDHLTKSDTVIQLGVPPLRIDLITGVDGLDFSTAYRNRVKGDFSGIAVSLISVGDLLKNKKAVGRDKDVQDVKWIKKYMKTEKAS